jgi:hypothetical protein
MTVATYADGTLLQGDGSRNKGEHLVRPELYVIEGGKRRHIPDIRAFYDQGYDPNNVQVVDDAELERLPLAADTEMVAPGATLQGTLESFLGAGHYMTTRFWFRNTGSGAHLDAQTRTQTITMFGGFRGGVQLLYGAQDESPVGISAIHSFGVDGTWIGRSDRTDPWFEDYPPDWADRTTSVTVAHFWDPNALADQLAKAVAILKPVGEIFQILGGIGASLKTFT